MSGHFPWRHFGSNLPRCQATAALVYDTAVVACTRTPCSRGPPALLWNSPAQPALQTRIGCPRNMHQNALRRVSAASKDQMAPYHCMHSHKNMSVCHRMLPSIVPGRPKMRDWNYRNISLSIPVQCGSTPRQRDGAWRTTMTTALTPTWRKSLPHLHHSRFAPPAQASPTNGIAVACQCCRHWHMEGTTNKP